MSKGAENTTVAISSREEGVRVRYKYLIKQQDEQKIIWRGTRHNKAEAKRGNKYIQPQKTDD